MISEASPLMKRRLSLRTHFIIIKESIGPIGWCWLNVEIILLCEFFTKSATGWCYFIMHDIIIFISSFCLITAECWHIHSACELRSVNYFNKWCLDLLIAFACWGLVGCLAPSQVFDAFIRFLASSFNRFHFTSGLSLFFFLFYWLNSLVLTVGTSIVISFPSSISS